MPATDECSACVQRLSCRGRACMSSGGEGVLWSAEAAFAFPWRTSSGGVASASTLRSNSSRFARIAAGRLPGSTPGSSRCRSRRANCTVHLSVSRIRQAAAGLRSRGWPTDRVDEIALLRIELHRRFFAPPRPARSGPDRSRTRGQMGVPYKMIGALNSARICAA
jgi:hypothetical protein